MNGLSILIVDDNTHMRAIVRMLLQSIGIERIGEAPDGIEGYEAYKAETFDVIITDISMPEACGVSMIRRIRTERDSPNPYVPIIALSGYTNPVTVFAARDAGVNEYLSKPVTAKGLIDRLRALQDHPRAFVKTESYFGPCRRRKNWPDYAGPRRRAGEASGGNPADATAA